MADLSVIRAALAEQVTKMTGLRTLAEARDQVNPPVAVILAGQPLAVYGATMDAALTVNLRILLLISDGPPVDKVQRALDAYLGIGSGETESVAGAIQADPSLGGTVHYAVPVSAGSYGRLEFAGQVYFGARVDVELGVI